MRDENNKLKIFSRRIAILGGLKAALFFVLFFRYYSLQVSESTKYKTLSDKNRIKLLILPPIRGLIRDRNNKDIATNLLTYRLSIDSRSFQEIMSIIDKLNGIIGNRINLSEQEIKGKLKRLLRNSYFTILEDLKWEEIIKLELHSHDLPNVVITQGQKRFYTNGIKTAHLTGYIGSPTESDLAKFPSLNYNDFVIGKNGVEKVLDEALRGYPGVKKIEVDALGTQIRELSNTPPIPGKTLKLSIDLELQDYISEVLGTNAGTVVVLNIKTGELLALYSSPSYDPNLFIGGISTQDWEALVSNPNTPLINKAISSAYPPGSTFKLVTAAAALEYGIPADYKVFCNGQHKVGNRIFHCNRKSGHGYVDIKFAIAQSCNVYFYTVAEKIGMKNLAKAAHALGLGSKTDIELPYEAKGNIPEPTWKILKFRQNWTLGDTVNASIGQGFILTTPIQLAVMAANIASGKQVKPTILYQETPQNFQDLSFDARHISTLKLGMFMVFNHHQGNGYKGRINDPSFQLCGKTGTAQVISSRVAKKKHHVDHGLFMGFAPYHDPTYAISVIIEHGSWGAGSALPIAKMILNKAHLMNP